MYSRGSIGQSLTELFVLIPLVVIMALFVLLAHGVGLIKGSSTPTATSFNSDTQLGNAASLSLPRSEDPFLSEPFLVSFQDGSHILLSLPQLAAVSWEDERVLMQMEVNRDRARDEQKKLTLQENYLQALEHAVTMQVFTRALADYLMHEGKPETCLIVGQSSATKLIDRLEAQPDTHDTFLRFDGVQTSSLSGSLVRLYYGNVLTLYSYSLPEKKDPIMLEYYHGPCLGEKK